MLTFGTEMTQYNYYVYQCDYGHSWVRRRAAGTPEPAADVFCPHGHEAVTCSEEVPADRVWMLFEPAARVRSHSTDNTRIKNDGMFYLVLLDHEMNELRRSTKIYGWQTAIKLMYRFSNKTKADAIKWWDRKPL